jgi:hypothetical protein
LEQNAANDVPWQGQPLVFSPDGKLVLGGAVRYRTADKKSVEPREIAVWDAATGKVLRRFGGGEWPNLEWNLLRVSGDGRTLLAQHWQLLKSTFDKKAGYTTWVEYTLRLWDYSTGKVCADSGKPLVIETTTAKRPAGPVLAQFPELAVDHGFGVRVSPNAKFMVFPRYPASPLHIFRGREDNQIHLTNRVTDKELHAFTDFDGHLLAPPGGVVGGNIAAAAGIIDKKGILLIWDITRWVEEAQRPLPDLTAKELAELWDKLGHEDPMQAYRAMRRLAASPKQSVPLLRERFAAHLKAQPALAALVAQLDDDKFAVRQKAQEALLAAGDDAIPALQSALAKPPSAEARQRLEKLLAQLETGRLLDPATRRLLWAVELCEHLATADAKTALEALAQGDADAWLTREARASLERLTRK